MYKNVGFMVPKELYIYFIILYMLKNMIFSREIIQEHQLCVA